MNNEERKVEKAVEKIEDILEELIDLEEWVKAQKKPCKAKRYKIRIDKEKYTVEVHSMTGTQILSLAGKTPDKYQLSERYRGGKVMAIQPDQVVEFHRCEVERFQTLAKQATEGSCDASFSSAKKMRQLSAR